MATDLGQGTKLNVEATIASLFPLDGEFLVLISFTKKNQKKTLQGLQNGTLESPPTDALPAQDISHENWLNSHGVETNTHTHASEETWRAVAADLASFNASPPPPAPVDPAVLQDGNLNPKP